MIVSIGEAGLDGLLTSQVRNLFLLSSNEAATLRDLVPVGLERAERCFKEIANKYYCQDSGVVRFDPYHSGQYSIFLYYLSRAAWSAGEASLADRLYLLNKTLSCCDLYHQIELPDVFFVEHPVGSVMGRARFGNYLVIQQNCTVGGNNDSYPVLGEYVWLFANSAVIGDARIGSNVFVAANALVKDDVIPDNTIVFGTSPNLILKPKPSAYFHSRSPFRVHRDTAAS